MAYTTTIGNLSLTQVDKKYAQNTCGNYYYLVQVMGMPSRAWSSTEAFVSWASARGISGTKELVKRGEVQYQALDGYFHSVSYMDKAEFDAINAEHTARVLQNGSYTLAKFTTDDAGIVTEHYCNPNVKDRVVFDYQESRAIDT